MKTAKTLRLQIPSRQFLRLLSAVLLTIPLVGHAQTQTKVPRIGVLSDEALSYARFAGPFTTRLTELGYLQSRNISFEYRYADGKQDRLPGLAADLVALKPDVIVAVGTPAALAAKNATKAIPIVFTRIGDPVGVGLVPALRSPGGNITGVVVGTVATGAKRLQLLKEAVPRLGRVGVLLDPKFPPATLELKEIEGAARSLNLHLQTVAVRAPDELEKAFREIIEEHSGAVFVTLSQMFVESQSRIIALAAKNRLPAIFSRAEFVEAGGLMSYGPNFAIVYRQAAVYVDKILKGAKPGDLPVEQPTKLELVINLKTAKAIGLKVPQSVLMRADELIK